MWRYAFWQSWYSRVALYFMWKSRTFPAVQWENFVIFDIYLDMAKAKFYWLQTTVKSFDRYGAENRTTFFFFFWVFKGPLAILENAYVWTKVLKENWGKSSFCFQSLSPLPTHTQPTSGYIFKAERAPGCLYNEIGRRQSFIHSHNCALRI